MDEPSPIKQADDGTPAIAPRKSLTKKTAVAFQEKQFLDNLPELSDVTYKALIHMIRERNPVALKIGADILKLTTGEGVKVNIQNNNVVQASSERRSFASLVRKLDDRERYLSPASPILTVAPLKGE